MHSVVASASGESGLPADQDSPDWDALEFSAVYQCLQDGGVFSQLDSACLERCDESTTELVHGQCVRPAISDVDLLFRSTWKLKVTCSPTCWQSKAGVSVHFVRLAHADHLDITFQEIVTVVLQREFEDDSDGRRLQKTESDAQQGQPISEVKLQITVSTRRILRTEAEKLMRSFFKSAAWASQLFGFVVHSVEWVTDAGPLGTSQEDPHVQGQDWDIYTPYYEDLEPPGSTREGSSIAGVSTEGIPTGVIIGLAAGVLALGAAIVVLLRYRRWRTLKYAEAQNAIGTVVTGKGGKEDMKATNSKLPNTPSGTAYGEKASGKPIAGATTSSASVSSAFGETNAVTGSGLGLEDAEVVQIGRTVGI